MLAIVGASGKLGLATLNALLDHDLIPASEIVATTSSQSAKLEAAKQKGVHIRSANWDDASSLSSAFEGVDKLFLISSSRIQKDFHDAPPGQGRESDHFTALKAAQKAGVKHVYYTSLAFANPSKSRVMKAHERTEEWLRNKAGEMKWTILREGLYNESWPLYLGHNKVKDDDRTEIPIAGDCKISWTSISNLGLASAIVLAATSDEWAGRTVYLSQMKSHTLREVAEMVSEAKGKGTTIKTVSREEHEQYYVKERGMDEAYIKWWAKTYDALKDGECEIYDDTLEKLLATKGVKPTQMEETIQKMLGE